MGNKSTKQSMSVAKEEIEGYLEQYAVVVLSKTYCPYCKKAKALLKGIVPEDKIKIVELDVVENGSDLQAAGTAIHGQRTVPQIWISKKFIGGNSEVQGLNEKNELKKLIEAAL